MFSSFQLDWKHIGEDQGRATTSDSDCSTLAYTELVPHWYPDVGGLPNYFPIIQRTSIPSQSTRPDTPTVSRNVPDGNETIRQLLQGQRLSGESQNILTASWRKSTWIRYKGVFTKWKEYCIQIDIDPFHPSVNHVINYLTTLFHNGAGYSAICTTKSALSSLLSLQQETTIAEHP